MDEPAIDAAGVTPLAPLLADIAAVQDAQGIQRMIRRLHELAVPAPFVVTAASDYHDPEAVVMNIAAGGLGLPGRDYYLKQEPQVVEAREKYRRARVDPPDARRHARRVRREGRRRDPGARDTSGRGEPRACCGRGPGRDCAQIARSRSSRNSPGTSTGRATSPRPRLPRIDVNVAEPAFLERVNQELKATSVTTWKAYLMLHLLESASPWLSKPFVLESFDFKDKYLGGATAMKPRAMRCVESTEALLGEPLGRAYAERYFPPAAKAKVQEMVRTMLAVLKDDLRELKWMSEATKKEALAKLEAYDVNVGYPDTWTSFEALATRRDAPWANVAAARRFGVELSRKRIGQRSARAIWQVAPSSPSAYIDVQLNLIALPAGFLQPWAFDLAANDAVNYGAIGAGVAHDLTHAIDALGAEFDSTGQPRDWWSQSDRDAFQKIGQCTVDQYDGYAIEPGTHHQGKRVLGEALGDLAGVRLAYRALKQSMRSHPVPTIDGLSAEQQFFIAWGQFRGASERLELQRQMMTGPHPTARYRVIGPLSNVPEFQQAFLCKSGSAMVRAPEQRCAVW